MVPSKKRSRRGAASEQDSATAAGAASGSRARFRSKAAAGKLSFSDYIKLNLWFDGFCVIQLIIVRMLLRDFAGLYFFFGFLMVAFFIASVFDYFSEKVDIGMSAGDSAETS